MIKIDRNHNKNRIYSNLAKEILFSTDFINLCEELMVIYKKEEIVNHEGEAFSDTFYCLLSQRESPIKAQSY